ncbi:MAG: exosome complex RNA-binding protein Rrp4 [Nanoarchaeota archaeon]|nr:exosome complex RNA-binding protein Rrp4 [Nanoarchaeota archaeon]
MSNKKEIVIPGEVIGGKDMLPGDNAYKDGENVLAQRYGFVETHGKVIKVIPISGVFVPRRGNVIIAQVTDITFNGWLADMGIAYNSFLPVAEIPKYLDKNSLAEFLEIGDFFTAKIRSVKQKGIDLTMDSRGMGKLEGGMIVTINPNKVPRVIGKEGSMIKIIKDASDCRITVGQNGLVWIKGDKIEDELLARKAIEFITEKSLVSGLTEMVEKFLKEESKK